MAIVSYEGTALTRHRSQKCQGFVGDDHAYTSERFFLQTVLEGLARRGRRAYDNC
jgi:hypothetical protein